MTDTHRTWTKVRSHGSYWQDAIAEDGQIVARVIGGGYPTGVGWSPDASQRANLIAAAPDLLAALKYVMPWLETHIGQGLNAHELADIRATIAKATGEETNA